MSNFLRKILKIYKGEGLKVFQFILLGALLYAGVTIGLSLTDTLFLHHVGAQNLPIIYMIMPIIMVVFTPVYSYLMSRYGIDKIFNLILGILIGGGIIFFIFTSYSPLSNLSFIYPTIFYIAKLYAFLWLIALYTIYWNFIDSYFDILDAKRLFSLFSGGLSIGSICGGVLVTTLIKFIDEEYLFLAWSIIAILTIPVLYLLRKNWNRIEYFEEEEEGFVEQTTTVMKYIKTSRYVLLLNLIMLFLSFLITTCEAQYFDILEETDNLASLFGKLYAVANIFNLIINFFLFNRMISFVGVRNMTLFQPVFYIFAFGYLLFDYGFGAALFGFFTYQAVFMSIDLTNWNFIYNAVPSNLKTSVRTFVENLMDPLGTGIAGVFLYLTGSYLTHQNISFIGLSVAVIYLVIVVLLRNTYLRAMITNLKKGWLDFSKSEKNIVKDIDESELSKLENYALKDKLQNAITAIRIIYLKNPYLAMKVILKFFIRYPEKDRVELMPLFEMILQEEDNEIIRQLLLWIEENEFEESPSLVEVLGTHNLIQPQKVLPLLDSPNPLEKGAAAISLLNSWDIGDSYQAMKKIRHLLEGNKRERKIAIRILGKTKQERYAHFLAPYLNDEDPKIRLTTLTAIEKLVNHNSTRLIPNILDIIENGDEKEIIIGMEALEKIHDSTCIVPLLLMSELFTPHQKRRLEKLIIAIGLQSVPTIVAVFRGRQYTTTARSIAARALSKLAFPQFEIYFQDIINTVILRAYEFLYFHLVLEKVQSKTPGITVLAKHYKDIHDLIIEFILELLTVGGRLPDFELISSSIRSNNMKVRANAIETIEQGISRNIFKLLLPLVDSRTLDEKIQFYRSHYSFKELTAEDIICDALNNSKFPLECSAAAQALWECSSGMNDLMQILREKITEKDILATPLIKNTILSLLSDRTPYTDLNVVEKVYYLASSKFFQAFGIKELQLIAKDAKEIHYEKGDIIFDKGSLSNALYYIVNGEVLIKRDTVNIPKHSTEIFGEGSFFGEPRRAEIAYSNNATVLVILRKNIFTYAKTYPKIAIELLKNRLAAK